MYYYQFNIGDYASHTQRLSIYEDIAYRRLLDLYYLSELPLNGCSTDVAREIGMIDYLSDVEYILNKFFIEKNNAFRNKRCDLDIKSYHGKQKSAKKAGIASGIARKKKGTVVERTLNEKGTDAEPTINHKPLTINQETKIKTRASPFVIQDNIDLETWNAFVEHRRKLKASMTDRAKTLIIGKLNKLSGNNNDILNQSIASGWKGVFELKEENNNGAHKQNSKPSLAERVTENRKRAEQQIDEQSMGANGAHIRS